jgi:hypothetical protein
MAGQDFQVLLDSGLLRQVEQIVVEGHRNVYESRGLAWSAPIAYRWLRYEDPTPVARLAAGTKRLRKRGVEFDSDAVEKACAEASKRGYLN